MGTWGTDIFEDDFALDVKEDFLDLVSNGKTSEEATSELMKSYNTELSDIDVSPIFWLSLAAIQWEKGRLTHGVKSKALEIIDTGVNLTQWEGDSKSLNKRKKHLMDLKTKLSSPLPPPRKITPRYKNTTNFGVGDVFSYETKTGKYILFRVIGYHSDKGGTFPICELLDWIGFEIPSKENINKLPIKGDISNKFSPPQYLVGSISKDDLPSDRVHLVLKNTVPVQKPGGYTVYLWKYLDKMLESDHNIT